MRKSVLAAAAALSMLSMSSGAVAQSAAPLSLAAAPQSLAAQGASGATTQDVSDIRGGFILPTLAIIIIGVLIYVVAKGGNNSPASP